MSLRCGLIGLPSCGKTTIFNAITSARASMFDRSEMNRVVVNVADPRMDWLTKLCNPRKVVPATLEVVDIPGISSDDSGRGSRLLGNIKDVDALLHVVRCFANEGIPGQDTVNPARDVESADLEMMAGDATTLENKISRMTKKVRARDKDAIRDSENCQKVQAGIQQGIPARRQGLSAAEMASVYDCNLLSLKPVLYIANVKNMADAGGKHVQALQEVAGAEKTNLVVVCGKDEADISELEPCDREVFMKELGIQESSMQRLIRVAYRQLGLINFFTIGEDEVRAWTCNTDDKAPVAAGKIHSDMLNGFIRMEVMSYADLSTLGSEDAVARAGKKRLEGREYQVQDGDIVSVLFNVRG